MTDIIPTKELATPEALIAKSIDRLRKASETDIALLDILSEHILTLEPSHTAVDDATSAIEALATKRVKEAIHGSPD